MPNPTLPAELLDYIADLRDSETVLRKCCLVSQSWIPPARKHLFTNISFDFVEQLDSWKRTFPDPSTSPACYAKTLVICCPEEVAVADAEAGGWIRGFSRVIHLDVGSDFAEAGLTVSFVPLHGFSSFVKSLHIDFIILPASRVFNLILSFPLLEGLSLTADDVSIDNCDGPDGLPTVSQPLIPPMFTGSLRLFLNQGGSLIIRWLLSLPAGIHFREFTLTWLHAEDPVLTMAVVEKCSHAIESLVTSVSSFCNGAGTDSLLCFLVKSVAIDLSKATKLRNVVFRPKSMSVKWITTGFRITIPELPELGQISIRVPYNLGIFDFKKFNVSGGWPDLDRLLVQFRESRCTRPKVICMALLGGRRDIKDFLEHLLPELTRRGRLSFRSENLGFIIQ